MMRRTTGLALAALALTVTSACGGSSSDDDDASAAKTSSSPTAAAPSATTPAPAVESVSPDERPSTKQLSETLKAAGLPAKQATCFSKALDKSKLPDELLAALVNRDEKYKPSAKETSTYQKIAQDAAASCA